ncbi:MAG TPA: methyltransferase domain-containing protein [Vitreimonas sp.]|uniref:class I SAM-dependent methyltransferase n=1 Tax=Vitreimonas sp. TaxID=3069702 RepID=UPI002D59170D|nr:methyltransferase domain-containing protein [Vitreimonas sp.]HYD89429.1 methyltransferase domain-containing protein [Vitreimonas sp.]
MRVDVLALQRFYASPLGEAARRAASRRLTALWPGVEGLDVLGLGYPSPYLGRFRDARRTVAMMPAAQGAEPWSADNGRIHTTLADETRLPFMDAVFDRVLLVHALEECDATHAMLREVWRVMAPEGRLVVIAANRWSLWAQSGATPFGHGRPYSRTQLAALLADSMFEPVVSARALYTPPLRWGWLVRAADAFESVGELLWPPQGGVVLMEAVKRLYANTARSEGRVLLAKAPRRTPQEAPGNLPKRDA